MISVIAGAAFAVVTVEAPTGLVGTIGVQIQEADGTVVLARTTADITEVVSGSGTYRYEGGAAPDTPGRYMFIWDTGGSDPIFSMEFLDVLPVGSPTEPPDPLSIVDLTDLAVMVPWARRACEGPYGPPANLTRLEDGQLYDMVADACAEVILLSGSLFNHELIVSGRDQAKGYPTQWKTDCVLDQWECAVIICQAALTYWRFLFRDIKTSLSIKNEGTEYSYTLSANVIAGYIKQLQADRDQALNGLRFHNPVLDRYASNIRVRDQATVAVLEWWDNNTFDQASGLPGGQEAAVIPWTPGWSGPGMSQGY